MGDFAFRSGRLNVTGASGLIIGPGELLGQSLTLGPGKTLSIAATTLVEPNASLTLAGGGFNTGRMIIASGGVISALGSIDAPVEGAAGAQIQATGSLSLGDARRYDGFNYDGTLGVAGNTVTLLSKGFANLGVLTTLDGGTINALNGVVLGVGDNIAGTGNIVSRIAASHGSTIEATGDLSLGDADTFSGFTSDGEMRVHNHTVTLYDADAAVVGSLTTLGDGNTQGTLVANSGLLIEAGKSVTGFGTLDTPNNPFTPLINNGLIAGDSEVQPIILTGFVVGGGTFDNIVLSGTFAPGSSTSDLRLGNARYGSSNVLALEIAGTEPLTEYGQLNHIGIASVAGTLDVSFIDGFEPAATDTFTIVTASDAVIGTFDAIRDVWITDNKYLAVAYSDIDVTLSVELLGDVNGDHAVNGMDVDPFVQSMLLGPHTINADMNQDGQVNGLDVDPFVAAVVGPGVAAVPEPSTLVLSVIALGVIGGRRKSAGGVVCFPPLMWLD
jgi:hypothetical protein